jgi:hypothetical protein
MELRRGLDLDLLILEERGGTHAGPGSGSFDSGDAGDRLLASGGRVTGPGPLGAALAGLRAAALASGWAGGRPRATLVDPDHREGAEGREKAMMNSLADAAIPFPGACPRRMGAHGGLGCPPGAVGYAELGQPPGCLATVRYLASGPNADGGREMTSVLRDEGFEVAG